jgi:hypothetical protein
MRAPTEEARRLVAELEETLAAEYNHRDNGMASRSMLCFGRTSVLRRAPRWRRGELTDHSQANTHGHRDHVEPRISRPRKQRT